MTFYRFNTGFGGMGSTYRTKREKSSYTLTRRILTDYETIKSRVANWRIENRDFRDLVKNLDGKNVFFYFDPPYAGKNWYDVDFSGKDMKDLKKITVALKGKFLCTLDQADAISASIFGDANKTVQFINENKKNVVPAAYREFSLYTNIKLDLERL
jgi:DNA adenine methylase